MVHLIRVTLPLIFTTFPKKTSKVIKKYENVVPIRQNMLIFVEYNRHKMDSLFEFQASVLKGVNNGFRRYLFGRISWGERMIGIKGPRGSGKTTLILQHLKYDLDLNEALYVTADHTWFYSHSLYEAANEWNKRGGKYLFIDEVHKYKGWSSVYSGDTDPPFRPY